MKQLCILIMAAFLSLSAVAQSTQPSDEIALGIWYEGGIGALRQNLIPEDPAQAARMYNKDFKDIAAHGIRIVVVPNTPPAHHKVLLDAAEKITSN